jgi:hypothetical protein
MKIEPLLLALDERNLGHFLSAIALANLASRISGEDQNKRTCWWLEAKQFAIQSEFAPENFQRNLFVEAHRFLTALKWIPGLGGTSHGLLTSDNEIGVNPFIALGGDTGERPLLRTFSAKVVPTQVLPQQIKELKSPSDCPNWLEQLAQGDSRRVKKGVSSWGFDCRVNTHASDAGISSDAEGTGSQDPIFPAIELLSVAAAAFFAPAHTWSASGKKLRVAAWIEPVPLGISALAGSGCSHGLPARFLNFARRGSAHGKGGAYRYFPEAALENSPTMSKL